MMLPIGASRDHLYQPVRQNCLAEKKLKREKSKSDKKDNCLVKLLDAQDPEIFLDFPVM